MKRTKRRSEKAHAPSEASLRLSDVLPMEEERMDDVLELPANLVEKFMKLRSPPSPGRPDSSATSPQARKKVDENDGKKVKEEGGNLDEESILSEMDTSFVPEIHVEESADASRILQQSMMERDQSHIHDDSLDDDRDESMGKSLDSTFEEIEDREGEKGKAKYGEEEEEEEDDEEEEEEEDDEEEEEEEDDEEEESFIEPSNIIQSGQQEPETPDAEYSSFKNLVKVLLEKTRCTDLKELQEAFDEGWYCLLLF
jgi:hypothetical protein